MSFLLKGSITLEEQVGFFKKNEPSDVNPGERVIVVVITAGRTHKGKCQRVDGQNEPRIMARDLISTL